MRLWHFPKREFEATRKRWDFGGKEEAEQGIQQAGETMYQRGQMTPQESAQYGSSFKTGDLLNQLYLYKAGLGSMPTGYVQPSEEELFGKGELASTLYQSALTGAKNPYAAWESSLEPQMQLAMDAINRQAANRGLLQSGIPLEAGSRAAAEYAVADAQGRMQTRQQELARAAGVYDTINQAEQQRYANAQGLYGQQQQYGLTAMQRQAQQAQQAAQYQSYPYQAQLGNAYGQEAGLWKTGGSILGTVAGGALGSIVPGVGTLAGAYLGGQLGGGMGGAGSGQQGGSYAPQSYYDYVAGSQNRPKSLSGGV